MNTRYGLTLLKKMESLSNIKINGYNHFSSHRIK